MKKRKNFKAVIVQEPHGIYPEQTLEGTWVYWRFKDFPNKSLAKSYVQEVTKTKSGDVLSLGDRDTWTKYPMIVALADIIIIPIDKPK